MSLCKNKLQSETGGLNRAIVVLLALICVMLVIIAGPAWKVFRYRFEKTGCDQAMKSAGDGLIIEYLNRFEEESLDEAITTLDEVMPGRTDLCPAHGNVYLVKREDGIYEPVCGLHGTDRKQRVRLNASRAMMLLKEALKDAREESQTEPESVEITLNGKPLECVRVMEEQPLRWGTKTTNGFEGIVAFYGIAGEGDFSKTNMAAGEIAYFVYADENHAAVWRARDGWTGDAYQTE